ncbi:MAG: SDR family NAD(P)-dependent oxidoreductase [Gemmatimonadetes bacterium]|nr:SDR family NAD(P)-dependent oxidoreductase [Gemmatimonadota bacterium]
MSSKFHALVTGGAGFIGCNLARHLLSLGHRVRVIDNLSTGFTRNLDEIAGDIEFLEGDLRDTSACDRATTGVEVIFHVAALPSVPRSLADPVGCHENNVTATLNLLESARKSGVRRMVFSASSSAYGDTPTLPKVESMEPLPRSPYAAAKLAGELYTLAYARAGLIEGVALRYFNVFGPRQDPHGPYAAVVPALFSAAVRGVSMGLFGDGLQTRDFTSVENVLAANLLAATLPAEQVNGAMVNVGAGQRTSLLELVDLVSTVTGHEIAVTHRPPREGDVRDSLASLERARAVLGYEPVVPLREGIASLWNWLQAHPEGLLAAEPNRTA